MNLTLSITLLCLESILLYAFTASFQPPLLFPALLPLLLLSRAESKILKGILLIACLSLFAFLLSSSLSLITPVTFLILSCQCIQLRSMLMIRLRRSSSVGILFTISGIVSSYIAYSPFAVVMDTWLSNVLGTIILLFSILSSDFSANPGNKKQLLLRGQGSLLRYTILSVLVCISIALATWLAPFIEYASEDIKYWVSDFSFWHRSETTVSSRPNNLRKATGPFKSSEYLWGGEIELKKQYDIKLPHHPEIHLVMHEDTARRMQRNEGLYLKCSSYDYFDAKRWGSILPGRKLVRDEDDGERDGTIALTDVLRNPVTYSIMLRSCPSGILPCIPDVSVINLKAIEKNQNDIFYAPMSLDNVPLLSYTMTSSDVRWRDIARGRRAIGDADEIYLHLPAHPVSGRITRLTKEILAGERNKVRGVDKLHRYMRRQYKYSLKTENKSDMHPIDNFLFEEKKGHCELFASSFTLMLRSMGVPARMSCGYSGGEFDPGKEFYTFYQDNAHAWVEVYLKEYGWVLIDPTPSGSSLVAGAPKRAPFKGSFSAEAYVQLDALVNIKFPSDDLSSTGNTHALYRKLIRMISSPVTISLAAVFVGLISVFLIRKPGKGKHHSSSTFIGRRSKDMPGYFKLFCKYFSKMGHPLRRGQTPREYLQELKQCLLISDKYDEMIEYFEEVCYGQRVRSKALEKQFTAIIRSAGDKK